MNSLTILARSFCSVIFSWLLLTADALLHMSQNSRGTGKSKFNEMISCYETHSIKIPFVY
jgi:hypothetical protein